MDAWLAIYLTLGLAALLGSTLMALQTWEHRRFVRSRIQYHQRPSSPAPQGRVALFAPCKGLDHDLVENLRPLFEQDRGNYEIVFVVESQHDPAWAAIRELMGSYPHVDSRLVVAGIATESGQKVHNLLAATGTIGPDIEALAFVDSDARPNRQWLRRIIERLDYPEMPAATGYRWFVPARPTLANHLLYSIDCSIVALVGPCIHRMVWGGSWAIDRRFFDECRLREHWIGTLSDDLVAGRVLANTKKRVGYQPASMLASPVDVDMRGMLGFIRRQYTIGRFYAPLAWSLAFVLSTMAQIGLWSSVLLGIAGLATSASWAWMPVTASILLYALYVYRGWLRQDASRYFLPDCQPALASARRFDIWCNPLAGLVSWIVLISTAFNRRIVWRGIVYEMFVGGKMRVLHRPAGKADQAGAGEQQGPPYRKAG